METVGRSEFREKMQETISRLVAANYLFVVNHSGGKDSQAMLVKIRELVPDDQIVCIHSDLGEEVEWDGVQDHIRETIGNLPLVVTKNENKTFIQMVERRGMFPSPTTRQCTSDLKRGPIERAIRHYLKARPEFEGRVVNCMGLRAEESSNRAKATVFKKNAGNSVAGREWYDLLPIHDLTTEEVFATISEAGQEPHPIYSKGMRRLSCRLCIYSSPEDVRLVSELAPETYAKYVALERRVGHTMMMPLKGVPRTLEEYSGVKADFELYPQDLTPQAAIGDGPEVAPEPEEYAPTMSM